MKKWFYLPQSYDVQKGFRTIKELNDTLEQIGVSFQIQELPKGKQLVINVDDEKIAKLKMKKTGRPVKYHFDYEKIQEMQKEGMSNIEIYTELGMSKSLFYQKIRECKKIMESSRTEQDMK